MKLLAIVTKVTLGYHGFPVVRDFDKMAYFRDFTVERLGRPLFGTKKCYHRRLSIFTTKQNDP